MTTTHSGMIVLGLSGKAGTGKSTLADLIVARVPNARRAAFGDPMKDETAAFFGFPRHLCDTPLGKRTLVVVSGEALALYGRRVATVRELIQWYGTDYRRAQNPHYWLWAMDKLLARLRLEAVPFVVIDDVRFPEEAEMIRSRTNYFLARLDPFPGWAPGPNAGHATETALDDWLAQLWSRRYAPRYGELEAVADLIVAQAWGL